MQDAKTNLSKLVSASLAGQEVVIANRGVAVVRLVPYEQPTKRP
ncbi:MAG: type II toxin-antitoxin system prevent-host-death family antitoxin, partial [Coriobacteriaceae bacterium]|nr:type II toxin-antitoxin system prevent-host-death family antitoxin [Coriobacteriaceae bacterium]